MTTLTVRPKNKKELLAIKTILEGFKVAFETTQEEETPYNAKFVAKIMRAREDSKQGRVTVIKTEDLWK